ncbi:MAG: glucose 1-dehydrogenase [Synergistaceae bacterium]|jgi:2-deoxy-D-gluconate 3-dehydrogenase|nr:glucose 1-dehydrogenase [Synergistaceae bacterium]
MRQLEGKVAIVTGANRGIGKAIATAYALEGAYVALVCRSEPAATVKEIENAGGKCAVFHYDFADVAGTEKLVKDVAGKCGTIDILFNNAGTQSRHPCTEFPLDDWTRVLDINCNAVFFMCQQAGKVMIEKGYGKIINMASLLSFQGGLTVPAYAASKGAVMQFTKSLSNEWAKLGVNVNCIAPGYLDTEMNAALINDPVRSRQILERIPAGRWGKAEDIAGAAVFLASSASDYVTGIVLPVDGGWLGR